MMDDSKLSDAELLALVSAGNADAEEALAERYSRLVRICARPLFLIGGDSEDLIQEGMLGLLSAIRQYDPASNVPFKAFAEVCISNRIYSAIKSASRQKHSPLNSGISLDSILSEAVSYTHLANRLLKRVRDYAQVRADGVITKEVANAALLRLEVDEMGLDATGRRMLRSIIEFYHGGPVGLETLAATIGEEAVTLEDVYEPYLLQQGFLTRTPRGRCVTRRAYEHLGLEYIGQQEIDL